MLEFESMLQKVKSCRLAVSNSSSCICGKLPHLGHLFFGSNHSEACRFLLDEENVFIKLRWVGIHTRGMISVPRNFQNKLLHLHIKGRRLPQMGHAITAFWEEQKMLQETFCKMSSNKISSNILHQKTVYIQASKTSWVTFSVCLWILYSYHCCNSL